MADEPSSAKQFGDALAVATNDYLVAASQTCDCPGILIADILRMMAGALVGAAKTLELNGCQRVVSREEQVNDMTELFTATLTDTFGIVDNMPQLQ